MMDTTCTPDSPQLPHSLVEGRWTIRERDPRSGLVVAEKKVKNILTNYGLTALVSAISGAYTPPIYLVIDGYSTGITTTIPAGSSSVTLNAKADILGDTQLVLSVGLATQEIVTFSSVSGAGPYTYTLTTPTAQAHNSGELAVRNVMVTDDMTTVQNEQVYDSSNPTLRTFSPGGYSAGNGNWTIQFYIPAGVTILNFITCGLADSPNIGQGNLHNHFVLGYVRPDTTNDVEIDGSITIANA